MGSLLGDWPSFDPHNFSQISPADPAAQPTKLTPVTYHATHDKTLPPPNQVITTESKNILLRQFYQKSEEKRYGGRPDVWKTSIYHTFFKLRQKTKRAASENLMPEHSCKQPRGPTSDV